MVVVSFVKYGNIHNAINFTFSIPCDAYLDIFYGLLCTFSSGPLRFCQQKHFSSCSREGEGCEFKTMTMSARELHKTQEMELLLLLDLTH